MNVYPNPDEILKEILSKRKSRPPSLPERVPPTTELETLLCTAWEEVLGFVDIGIDDNFFSYGGDSLQMIQIASYINEKCGLVIHLEHFFESPTIRMMAGSAIEPKHFVEGAMPPLKEVANEEPLPWMVSKSRRQEEATPEDSHSSGNNDRISAIVIPTRDRPASLARCLSRLCRNMKAFGHTPIIWIADDSSNSSAISENQLIATQSAKQFGLKVNLLAHAQKSAIVADVQTSGIDPALVEFIFGQGETHLFGGAIGANRNWLTLATVGRKFLSADDDTECVFSRRHAPPLRISRQVTNEDPSIITRLEPHEAQHQNLLNVDLVESHNFLLGKRGDAISRNIADTWPSGAMDDNSLSHEQGIVRVTLNGLHGDCGWGSPSLYLFTNNASFDNFSVSDDLYREAVTSRLVNRAPACISISREARSLMTTSFGADNRIPLPPFVPYGRGSDAIFSQLLKRLYPDTLYGHLPWSIYHSPAESRRFWPGEILRSATTSNLMDVLSGIISVIPNPKSGHQCTASYIGKEFLQLGNLSPKEFKGVLLDVRRLHVMKQHSFLAERLAKLPPQSTYCLAEISEYMGMLLESLKGFSSAVPSEFQLTMDIEMAAFQFQRYLKLYGESLIAWDSLVPEISNRISRDS